MIAVIVFIAVVIILILIICAWDLIKTEKEKYARAFKKYENIIDVDSEVENKKNQLKQFETDITTAKEDIEKLNVLIEELIKNKEELDIDLMSLDCGLYKPQFNYEDSNRYKIAIEANRRIQKNLIANYKAINSNWELNSKKRDIFLVKARKIAKLMLHAFNGECDSLIECVKWNNILKIVERLEKVFNTINDLAPENISISNDYLKLKLEDLYLTYEYKKKLQEEKEEQTLLREQMREEKKIQEEIARREREIEEQEKQKRELEEQLRIAFEQGQQDKINELQPIIENLNQTIEDNKHKVSNAQLTKNGHIYIISNIGSFGENIYKIGMTRREEPTERIYELSNASVPFPFDIHAIIKADDAPAFENAIHKELHNKRVNLNNLRKEFFNVSLEEIEEIAKKINPDTEMQFTKLNENMAEDYRITLKLREQSEGR